VTFSTISLTHHDAVGESGIHPISGRSGTTNKFYEATARYSQDAGTRDGFKARVKRGQLTEIALQLSEWPVSLARKRFFSAATVGIPREGRCLAIHAAHSREHLAQGAKVLIAPGRQLRSAFCY